MNIRITYSVRKNIKSRKITVLSFNFKEQSSDNKMLCDILLIIQLKILNAYI